MKIDPRSDRIALHYTGNEAGEPAVSGVPARDLTENDIARLVGVEHGELRGAAHTAAVDKLVADLSNGPYRRTAPTAAKGKSSKKTPPPVAVASPTPAVETPAEPSADSAEGAPS